MKKTAVLVSIIFLLFTFKVNSQNVCIDMTVKMEQSPLDAQSAAFLIGKTWNIGQIIKVKFMGGSPYVQKKVIHFAKKWEQHANIKFDFDSNNNGDIRISFISGIGSWSYLGIDAKQIPQNEPTMNFGWFDNNTTDDEFSRTTIHEFGHALGLIHEHQHPGNNIPWNKPVVYGYYLSTQGWTREKVDNQVFSKYSVSQTYLCSYDINSIMHYPIPQQHTIGDFEVGWNSELSAKDKNSINNMYPFIANSNPYWTSAGNLGKWYIGNFDGKGGDDIFRYMPGESGADVFLSDGSKFVKSGSWTDAGNGQQDWYIGDFNGDGKDDIFRYMPGESGADVFLSDGSKFVKSGSWTGAGNAGKWYIGNFDGKGGDDIFRYMPGESGADVFLSDGSKFVKSGSWTGAGNGQQDWYIGDFNGDGKDDIFRYMPGESGADVFLSDGSKFVNSRSWIGAGNLGKWYIGNFDGKGGDDIFRYMPGESGADVFLSDGSIFVKSGSWTDAGNGQQDWYIGDFNGDGKIDVFRYSPNVAGAHMFLSNGIQFSSSDEGCDSNK